MDLSGVWTRVNPRGGEAGADGVTEGSTQEVSEPVGILIVDDRAEKRLALRTCLEPLGERLIVCASGKEALRVLLREEVAAILLDVNMPGMDGFETAELIRQRQSNASTPILFISAVSDSDNHVSRGYSLGAVDYLYSPFVPEILRAKVAVFVDLHRKARQIEKQALQLREMERRQHRERLGEAMTRLEMETRRNRFFTHSADLLCVTDGECCVRQANPSWEAMVGHETASPRGILEHIDPDDREIFLKHVGGLDEAGLTEPFEARLRGADGEERLFEWRVAQDSELEALYFLARDVTERKRAEAKIRDLNRELDARIRSLEEINKELEAYTSTISHDLRAPLRSVQSFMEILLETDGSALSEAGTESANRVLRAAERMDRLIQDLLTYSRLSQEQLELSELELDEIVEEALSLHETPIRLKKAEIVVTRPLQRRVAGCRPMAVLALSNLIGNAVKFAADDRAPEVRMWTEDRSGRVCLVVDDNGIGIPVESREKVFGLFTRLSGTRKTEGTGLGLCIARKAIHRMGGQIAIEDKVGPGTRFCLAFNRVG